MLLTEEEAKTKWCPFARVVPGILNGDQMRLHSEVPAHNRVDEVGADDSDKPSWNGASNCLGSACMAWRESAHKMCRDRRGNLVARDVDGTGDWVAKGYCGLAGKVEP